MNDKKTPIPLRASRKHAEPTPLTFPQPNRHIKTGISNTLSDHTIPVDMAGNPIAFPNPDPLDRPLTMRDLCKALYAIGHYDFEPSITMSFSEFEAFMVQVWEEE